MQVQKLQAILKPMMLRRLKEDVEKKLAPKEETIIEVELTNIQKKYYRAILEKNFSFLSKGAGQTNVPNLVNTMMELRKCCNHPYLIKGSRCSRLNSRVQTVLLTSFKQLSGKIRLTKHLTPRKGDTSTASAVVGHVSKHLRHYIVNRNITTDRLRLSVFDKSFYLPSLRLRITAPGASHIASLKEDDSTNAGAVMYGKTLYVEYSSLHRITFLLVLVYTRVAFFLTSPALFSRLYHYEASERAW